MKSPQHVHLTKSLTARLDVVLVGPAVFQQESVRVLNHPANRQVVAILDGSGFVHFAASSPQSVELLHDPKMRTLTITPVLDGDLVVEATDLCLAAKPTILHVVVAGKKRQDWTLVVLLLRWDWTAGAPLAVGPGVTLKRLLTGETLSGSGCMKACTQTPPTQP